MALASPPLPPPHSDDARAFQDGLTIVIVLVAVALVTALFDTIAGRHAPYGPASRAG